MTDTILPNPRIKCYAADTLLHNTVKTIQQDFRKLIDEDPLLTGESVYCICSHHVEQHYTIHNQYNHVTNIHCHGSNELCNCELFRARSERVSKLLCSITLSQNQA
jgi:hypothetical protein